MKPHSRGSKRAAVAAPMMFALLLAAHVATAQSNGAAANDIRDIRGPKPITSPWLMPLIAITVLAGAGGAYAAWAWNRRRFLEASERPLDVALARLERAKLLMLPLRGREFSSEVSSAVREYIESRFSLRAAHLTTDEFLHQLPETADSHLAAHRSLLDNFLQTCDLAKFGGWNLAAADMETMLQSARRFIVESADESRQQAQAAANGRGAQLTTSDSRDSHVSLPST